MDGPLVHKVALNSLWHTRTHPDIDAHPGSVICKFSPDAIDKDTWIQKEKNEDNPEQAHYKLNVYI